jgi:hypothetical protein
MRLHPLLTGGTIWAGHRTSKRVKASDGSRSTVKFQALGPEGEPSLTQGKSHTGRWVSTSISVRLGRCRRGGHKSSQKVPTLTAVVDPQRGETGRSERDAP